MALCHGQMRCAVLEKRAAAQKMTAILAPEWCGQMVTDSARWRAMALRLIWSIVGLWGIGGGADKWLPILRGTAQSVGMLGGRGRRPAMAAGLLAATGGGPGGRPRPLRPFACAFGPADDLRLWRLLGAVPAVLAAARGRSDRDGFGSSLGRLRRFRQFWRQFWRQLGAALAAAPASRRLRGWLADVRST